MIVIGAGIAAFFVGWALYLVGMGVMDSAPQLVSVGLVVAGLIGVFGGIIVAVLGLGGVLL